jgi:hypothetical protein
MGSALELRERSLFFESTSTHARQAFCYTA